MLMTKSKSEWSYAMDVCKSFTGASQYYFIQKELYQLDLRRDFQT